MVRTGEDRDRLITMLNNYPEEWIRRYVDRRYILEDAVHNHSLRTILPFIWSSLRRTGAAKQSETIFNEAGEFQLKDGISVPVRGLDHTLSVFSAVADGTAAERAEALRLNIGLITLLASLVHETAGNLALRNVDRAGNTPLPTAREREVLKWIASGKTSVDIAEILKISELTVNAHAQAAMLKLNATTRTHAAVVAALSGIVDLE